MPDIARDPAFLKRRRLLRIGAGVVAVILVIAVSIALARMEPAPPTVPADTLLRDTVKRGAIVRQVRGPGTLVPEDTRWIPATTDARVERILLQPGATVLAHSVILELSNPQVEQEALNARLQLHSAQAQLESLRVQFDNDLLTLESQIAALESEYEQARLDAETRDALAKQKLASEFERRQTQLRAESLGKRLQIEQKRLQATRGSLEARLRVPRATVDQAQAIASLFDSRLQSLKVRAGFAGVLQQVPVEVGQRVGPGTNLARVADPGRLKAALQIPETQAKDIEVGQPAQIDTRTAIIAGRVTRKDPAAANGTVTVDVTPTEPLPRGAVPDLGVDGTIQLERFENVLYVMRPSLGQENSTVGLYRVTPAGDAERVRVTFGGSSVTHFVVTKGLREGDEVILSDMSNWDAFDKVRLR
ncbi:MAG TPA: HlyD family efflux transporter periplasmic adaptor subunit [Vicinamibacterales bacterium]|nr:HlyD family efflux transporter periplasmic adaptor subunit [Vicinamibacterales bacterium]